MKLILLEQVMNLGNLGDTVTVRPGFGRNYLLPKGKALPATKANLAEFEARRDELERQAAERLGTAEARAQALDGVEVEFTVRVSPEGRLYGSIGPREIAGKLTEMGYATEKSEVDLPEGPIRATGEFDIELLLHADISATIKVKIAGEEGQETSE